MSKKDKEIFKKYWYVGGIHRKELYEKCFKFTKDRKEIALEEFDNYIYDLVKKEIEKNKKIKKRYRLKREVWETIAVCIAFIGLLMIIAGIEMMVF